jgi:hypothetical protein
MIKIIIEVVGNCKYEYVEWPNNYERIETGDFIVDIEKAKNILSWEQCIFRHIRTPIPVVSGHLSDDWIL